MTDDEIFDTVTSYADGFSKALRETGLSYEKLVDKLLDLNVEQCPTCRWWVEAGELVDDDGDVDKHCANCRPSGDLED
jgi:hypothetical protein